MTQCISVVEVVAAFELMSRQEIPQGKMPWPPGPTGQHAKALILGKLLLDWAEERIVIHTEGGIQRTMRSMT